MSKHRLLIIEDDQKIADLVRRVAAEADFDVRVVCNIPKIAAAYDEFKPHVIVLDIIMPDMDGFEVLSFLHKHNSSSRVVILSGQANYRSMADQMADGLDLAVAATVAKPFRVQELRQTLERVKRTLPPSNGDPSSEAAA